MTLAGRSFIEKMLQRPVAVSMGFGVMLLGGIFALTRLPLDLAPTLEYPALTIRTTWFGASPEAVEKTITAPIEELAGTVNGVHKISSESSEGESAVSVEFDPATQMDFARLQLNELLASYGETKPADVSPPVIEAFVPKDLQHLQGFMAYSLVGPRTPRELRRMAEEEVLPRLVAVKGVGNATVYGGATRQIRIEVDYGKAGTLGIELASLAQVIHTASNQTPVGALVRQGRTSIVTVRSASGSVADLGNLPVRTVFGGGRVCLKDIATVIDGAPEPTSFYRINGMQSVTIEIDKEQSVNMLTVANALEEKVGEIGQTLPAGCMLVKQTDQSRQLRSEMHNLTRDILLSVACIWLLLSIFLGNVRAPIILLSSILFSIAGTVMVFKLFNIGLNLLTIGGLALGFGRLVDDSIVVLDGIQRNAGKKEGTGWIADAVGHIAMPVFASSVTTVGALAPIAFLPPELRMMFGEFAAAVSTSLLLSLIVSFTLIPLAMSRPWASWSMPTVLSKVGDGAILAYQLVLKMGMRHRKLVVALLIWSLGLPVWLLPGSVESDQWWGKAYNSVFGSEFYANIRPAVNYIVGGASHLFFTKVSRGEIWAGGRETTLIVTVSFPQGTEIERYDDVARSIEREVQSADFGVARMTTRVVPDRTIITVGFSDSASVSALPLLLKDRLTLFSARTGGAAIGVYGFGPGFSTSLGGNMGQFRVKVMGYNYVKVRSIAEELRQRLSRNPRIKNIDIDQSTWGGDKSFELAAVADRGAIAKAGLTVSSVLDAIRQRTSGSMGYDLVSVEGTEVPLVIKLAGYREFSARNLENAILQMPKGSAVRIGTMVRFEERQTPSDIVRENHEYLRNVGFDYFGPYEYGLRYLESTIKGMTVPLGYRMESRQNFFWLTTRDEQSLLLIALVALVIVFMVTASLYESFRTPFIVILAVPFSLIGLFVAFFWTNTPFGRGGYGSVIMLIGVVVSNSIVLVDHIMKRFAVEGRTNDVLIEAASNRLRPVLMTTLATIAGLVPLVLGSEQSSVWYSLSLGTIGGLCSSTVLTLIVIPVIMSRKTDRLRT